MKKNAKKIISLGLAGVMMTTMFAGCSRAKSLSKNALPKQSQVMIIDDEQRVFSIIPENMEGNENYQYNWNIQLDQENYYNRIENENISNDDVILKYFEYYNF